MRFVGEEANLVAFSSFDLEFYLFKQRGGKESFQEIKVRKSKTPTYLVYWVLLV